MTAFIVFYIIFSLLFWSFFYILQMARFAWYDLWIGIYIDLKKQIIYICPLPCLVVIFHYEIEGEIK